MQKILRRFVAAALLACALPPLGATTYYVDSLNGSDANNGTSASTPWKNLSKVNLTTFAPGDSILFARGRSWTNTLWPKGSGSSGAPITIDAYGSGAAPRIQGGGANAAVYLFNQQHWVIRNLEITNTGTGTALRRGVHVKAEDAGTLTRIHLIDLEVHAVNGDLAEKNNGGIYFEIAGSTTPTKWDDLLIDGCYIHDVTRTGIVNSSEWDVRTATTNTNWTPSTNVVIRNNVIAGTAANGLIWRASQSPLIEHNIFADNAGAENGNAMFVFNCDDAIIQFNEAYGTVFNSTDHDAAGFDADYKCKRTVIQYNWSHDNGLGGIVAVGPGSSFNADPIIRYNILQDNAQQAFRISGGVTNALIYNNTIYAHSGLANVVAVYHKSWSGWPSGTSYFNNIFSLHGSGVAYDLGSSSANTFDRNAHHGHAARPSGGTNVVSADPLLAGPGTGGYGWDSVDGYVLLTGSPVLGNGRVVSGNGGRDYWGNAVSSSLAPHRGAYNGPALSALTVAREAEMMSIGASTGDNVVVVYDGSASGGRWLRFDANQAGDSITFSAHVPAGTYAIEVRVKRGPDRGTLQLATSASLNGTYYDKDGPKDLYAANHGYHTFTYTAQVTFPSTAEKYFRFTVAGKNGASSGHRLALDSLTLVKQ